MQHEVLEQVKYFVEERNGGTYHIPPGIWRSACKELPEPSQEGGVCIVCNIQEDQLFGETCQNCNIFNTAMRIASERDVPIHFIPDSSLAHSIVI